MSDHHHRPPFDVEAVTMPRGHGWAKLPLIFAVVGLAGLGAAAGLTHAGHGPGHHATHPWQPFYASYLFAYMFWLSLALGAMFFILAQHAGRAGWSVVVRRIAESLMRPLGLGVFAVLFIPIALGLHDLFHWSHADAVAHDAVLQHKASYLNANFFYGRAALYFLAWGIIAAWFWRKSVEQDRSGNAELTRRMQVAAGPALLALGLSLSFAAFDWLKSLDPHWFSTIFGIYFFAGSAITVFATMIVVAMLMRRSGLIGDAINVEHFHDLGKYLFAFTVFWAYIAFSQFMLTWYANLPEETGWFAARWKGNWRYLTIALGVGHFGFPFFLLMNRWIKRSMSSARQSVNMPLIFAALYMLCMQALDLYWLIQPTFYPENPAFSLVDLGAFIGVGGLYLAVVTHAWTRVALVPVKDPRLTDSLAFENF